MLFGSGYGETREDAIRVLTRYVTDPATPGMLKAENVKYILLHDDVYRAAGASPPPVPAGFHLVARIPGDVRALEIDKSVQPSDIPAVLEENAVSIAAAENLPVPTVVLGRGGDSGLVRGSAPLRLTWSGNPLARVQLIVHARTVDGGTHTLTLVDANGAPLGAFAIGPTDTQVTYGPLGVTGTDAAFGFAAPGSSIRIDSILAQPLADITKSIRSY